MTRREKLKNLCLENMFQVNHRKRSENETKMELKSNIVRIDLLVRFRARFRNASGLFFHRFSSWREKGVIAETLVKPMVVHQFMKTHFRAQRL